MASNIDETFPVSNVDQPSQGFRDNFLAAKDEIEALQLVKIPVDGTIPMTGELTLSGDPTVALHASTKQYVDNEIIALNMSITTQLSSKLSLTGGIMTGALILPSDPTVALQAATKQYVDDSIGLAGGDFLELAGGTMLGDVILSGDPTIALHAATMQYVDAQRDAIDLVPNGVSRELSDYDAALTGVDAYNSPDMPSQYMAGYVIAGTGSRGVQQMTEWNNNGGLPPRSYIRVKDDTNTAWSDWRGLAWSDETPSTAISSIKTVNYTTTIDDDIILVDTTAGPVTITLGTAAIVSGKSQTIKDMAGSANADNITIDTQAAETIDGAASQSITFNYESMTFVNIGGNWIVV